MKTPQHYVSEKPNLLKEWNWDKNKCISPNSIGCGSNKKVWWKCCVCGNEWEATPNSRNGKKGHGCPKCGKIKSSKHRLEKYVAKVGSLASKYPYLLQEWDYDKNLLNPKAIPPQMGRKVWWKCKKCGHSWEAVIQSRTKAGNGCPECGKKKAIETQEKNKLKKSGSLAQMYPELLKEWDFVLNDISPDKISCHYSKKVHWICFKGHEFECAPNRRVKLGRGCPICAKESGTSFPEQALYYYINTIIPCENRYLHKGIEIDVFIPSLRVGIEYDGAHYHSSNKALIKETKKNNLLAADGIRLIRVKESVEFRTENDIIYIVNTKDDRYLCNAINIILTKIGIRQKPDINFQRDRIHILEQYVTNEKHNSIVERFPDVAKQWDYDKNGRIKPEYIRAYSNHKFWWKCDKGHCWEATVYSRVNGNGCPCCSGKVLLIGQNDLLSQNPDIAQEWNYEKNKGLTPDMITIRNGKSVWWKCSICGYEWKTSVAHRSEGKGCPICGRKKCDQSRSQYYLNKNGSFVDIKPELLEEWDFEKNGDLNPQLLTAHNGRKVWWKCKKCGHSWMAYISNRTSRGSGCPYCKKKKLGEVQTRTALRKTGSIAQTHSYLLEEWDYRKNIIKPEEISIGSDRKVWWKCRFCGYEWEAPPNSSNRRTSFEKGCPACLRKTIWEGHNDLATTNPSLASEWNYERNTNITPNSITDGSNKKVWWICSTCGFEWQAVVAERNKGHCGCPKCKRSDNKCK
nr:zinc-ribbon domain-containing protein [uncultured Prevotella sp.]